MPAPAPAPTLALTARPDPAREAALARLRGLGVHAEAWGPLSPAAIETIRRILGHPPTPT